MRSTVQQRDLPEMLPYPRPPRPRWQRRFLRYATVLRTRHPWCLWSVSIGWKRGMLIPGRGHAWATQAWIGSDIQRLWLRSQGECYGGRCQSVAVDMLYGHDISPWWDALIGARRDEQPDGRTWAALGVQGVTPYKFESAAFLYLSGAAMRLMVETKYDLLLSQRLILQPSLQATAGLTRDRDLGAGPQTLQVGVRMRYQITRRVAPYVGWEREYGYGGVGARHAGVVPLTMKSAGWLGYAAGFERSCPVKHHNQ